MSSLIFAHAKSIYNKKIKHVEYMRKHRPSQYDKEGYPMDDNEFANACGAEFIEGERAKFRDILSIAQLLHEDYVQIVGQTSNWYFVTVRPRPGVTWEDFYILTYKYVNRAFMVDYKLSFEQKSTEGNGDGFHCHIVCKTKHRSKGEILRDTKSTFNKIADDNCIDIKPTRNPEDIVNNYLLAYKSDDEHKAGTQEGDRIWRHKLGLKDLYDNCIPKYTELLSSSPGQQLISDTQFCKQCEDNPCQCKRTIKFE